MKRLFAICLMMSMVLVLDSCDDFLGNKPKGYSIPQYFEDYAMLMQGGGIVREGDVFNFYFLSDNALMTDTADMASFVLFSNVEEVVRNIYTFQPGALYPGGERDNYYNNAYSNIYTCNVVANNIYDVPDAEKRDKDALWAEAVISRSYLYFKLVNMYAKHYNKATAAEDYGVPMVLNEDISKPYAMKTVQEIYDMILDDTGKALEFLPEKPRNIYHPGKAAGYGFLAKVYLYMGEYAKAMDFAQKALDHTSATMMDMTQYMVNDWNPFERFVDAEGNTYPKNHECPEVIWGKEFTDPSGCFFISGELYDLYAKGLAEGAVDQRQFMYSKDHVWFFQDFNFPGKSIFVGGINYTGGVVLQDLLLILAECEVRVNGESGIAKAMGYLDRIRDYRIKGNRPLTAANAEEALQTVIEERRREMAALPTDRWFDLKRLNLDSRTAKTIVHEMDGQTFVLEPNDPRYVMPLPSQVTDYNPDMPHFER